MILNRQGTTKMQAKKREELKTLQPHGFNAELNFPNL